MCRSQGYIGVTSRGCIQFVYEITGVIYPCDFLHTPACDPYIPQGLWSTHPCLWPLYTPVISYTPLLVAPIYPCDLHTPACDPYIPLWSTHLCLWPLYTPVIYTPLLVTPIYPCDLHTPACDPYIPLWFPTHTLYNPWLIHQISNCLGITVCSKCHHLVGCFLCFVVSRVGPFPSRVHGQKTINHPV